MTKYLTLNVLKCLANDEVVWKMANLYDILVETGGFDYFIKSLKLSGLDAVLRSPGAYTIFALHDTAFQRMPRAELNRFINEPEVMGQLLLRHITKGRYMEEILDKIDELPTLSGAFLRIDHSMRPAIKIENALIETGNWQADNGVIHVLDEVLDEPDIGKPEPVQIFGLNT